MEKRERKKERGGERQCVWCQSNLPPPPLSLHASVLKQERDSVWEMGGWFVCWAVLQMNTIRVPINSRSLKGLSDSFSRWQVGVLGWGGSGGGQQHCPDRGGSLEVHVHQWATDRILLDMALYHCMRFHPRDSLLLLQTLFPN